MISRLPTPRLDGTFASVRLRRGRAVCQAFVCLIV